MFVAGIGVFVSFSLLCGLAGSPTALNVSRGFQGVGAAMMFATALALIAQVSRRTSAAPRSGSGARPPAFAVAVGPLVGGALTESLGWEWIFFVNVPVGLMTIAMTVARMPESEPDRSARIDWGGLATFSVALFCLVLALLRGNAEGWGSAHDRGPARGHGRPAERLHRDRAARRGADARPAPVPQARLHRRADRRLLPARLDVLDVPLPGLYLQNILGYSPLEAGLRFLPISLLSFMAAPLAGKLAERWPVRGFSALGYVVGIGLLLMGGIAPGDGWTTLLPGSSSPASGSA